MANRTEIAEAMRKAAEALNAYATSVQQRVGDLLESRRKKLEFEALIRERRGRP